MYTDELHDSYFKWMCELVCDDKSVNNKSYQKLLNQLNEIQFVYTLPMDGNRAVDGVDLRYRFGYDNHIPEHAIAQYLDDHSCTVLEMMVALSVRCEEDIMTNPLCGNRTGKWFWSMVHNLGLDTYDDAHYVNWRVQNKIDTFMYRRYSAYGDGGLFYIKHPPSDLRRVEIWYQMIWYLNEVGDDT